MRISDWSSDVCSSDLFSFKILCMHTNFFYFSSGGDTMRREETVDYAIKATWHAIARMYHQQAGRHDITMSMGFVLLNIHADGTPATKIAPLMGLEARSLSRLLKTMEEKGLICRETDQEDKRKVRILLTKPGKIGRASCREKVDQ